MNKHTLVVTPHDLSEKKNGVASRPHNLEKSSLSHPERGREVLGQHEAEPERGRVPAAVHPLLLEQDGNLRGEDASRSVVREAAVPASVKTKGAFSGANFVFGRSKTTSSQQPGIFYRPAEDGMLLGMSFLWALSLAKPCKLWDRWRTRTNQGRGAL